MVISPFSSLHCSCLFYADYPFADASVTQSALEEALASKMQGNTIGSTISNVFRSRYLPK